MLFKRTSRTDPETVFIVVQNVSGGTLTAGYACCFDLSASVDGVRVTKPASANLGVFAGVADSDIADSGYGLTQVWGYRASAYVYSSTGSSAAGDILTPVNAEWGLTPSAIAVGTRAYGHLAAALSASSSSRYNTTSAIFVKAL